MSQGTTRVLPPLDEHDLYPVHEEKNPYRNPIPLPETPIHELLARYLKNGLGAYLPGKWVTGDICMYWEKGNKRLYAAPDVLVVDGPTPDPMPSVYRKWSDPPALLVAEIGSKSTFLQDEGPKLWTYGWYLGVPEYVYYLPERRELHLYRLEEGSYREVLPDARGWVHSETLGVWFGVEDAGSLRVYTPEGEALLTHEESESARREAEARAQGEAEARAAADRRVAELEEKLRRLGEDPGSA